MISFLSVVFLELIIHSSFVKDNKENNYLDKEKTKSIKGLFVILIIFSHFAQYVSLDSILDVPYLILRSHLDQMVVVPFLFYSGIGIMKSIQTKGQTYVDQILVKRIPKVWLNFVIAVSWFLMLNLALRIEYPMEQILLSFTGWESIGNSNWYILGILILYLASFLSFSIVKKVSDKKKKEIWGNIILTILVILSVWILKMLGKPSYYYNTLIVYSMGCWYVVLQERIEEFLLRDNVRWGLALALLTLAYCVAYIYRFNIGIISYSVWTILFTCLMLMLTMKLSIHSKFLEWFGEHVFSVYILQRIPMIILAYLGVAERWKYTFLILTMIFTFILVMIFEKIVGKIEKILFC